jgi:hypothetical protein
MSSNITRLRNKQEQKNELDNDERQKNVKVVVPAKTGGDNSRNDTDSVGDSSEHKVYEGDSETALVDKVEISYGGEDDGFVG